MNVNTLLELDRAWLAFFNGSHSLFVDSLALTLTSGFTWIPLYLALLYVIIRNNETMPQIALAIGCGLFCVLVASISVELLIKPLVARFRPTNDPALKYTIDTVQGLRGGQYGFFSAHAANTFSLAVFVSLLMRSRALGVGLVLWSAANCWTRLYLGLHYPTDILCGLIWGLLIALGAYRIYLHFSSRWGTYRPASTVQCTSSGYALEDIRNLLVVLSTLLCTIIIYSLITI